MPYTTTSSIQIIKGYFSLYSHDLEKDIRTKRFIRRYRKLSLNKIYVSNGEFKHTNNKVIINLYLFNRQKYNYISAIRKLYLKTFFSLNKKRNFKVYRRIIKLSKFKIYKMKMKNLWFTRPSVSKKIFNSKNSSFNSVLKKKQEKNLLYRYKIKSIRPANKRVIGESTKRKPSIIYLRYKLKMFKFNDMLLNVKLNDSKITKSNYKKNWFFKYKSLDVLSLEKMNQIKTELDLFKLYDQLFMQVILNIFNEKKINLINVNINNFKKYMLESNINNPFSENSIVKYNLTNKITKMSSKNNNILKYIRVLKAREIIINKNIEKILKNRRIEYKSKNINTKPLKRKLKVSRFTGIFKRKIITIRKKGLLLLKLINKEKYLVVNTLRKNKEKNIYFFISTYITEFYREFIKKSLKKLKIYFYYRQLLYINKSKYNYSYLQYLNKYLYLLYNKNIEYNLINLKRFYLHSDILSETITLKITRNRKRVLRKLKKLHKKTEKIIERNEAFISKKEKKIKKKLNHTVLDPKYLSKLTDNTKIKTKTIIERINHRYITGFRIETKGRLTRRYTASRSLSKTRYKGNLLNLNTLNHGLSSIMLKGNLKSNLQYTKLKSKSRIGSFGVKGWISGN